jgi:histidine triad (HIT) family protein
MEQKNDCIFCKIAAKALPAKVVFEDDMIVAFCDIAPQAPVHIVIISKEHIEKFSDLGPTHANLVGRMMIAAKEIAENNGIGASGYRIVMNSGKDGGQAVSHLHLHLLGARTMHWPPG